MDYKTHNSDLKRDLRLLDAVGIGLGAVIGAGIFVVTGVAAGVAGPAFLVGLVLAGIAATCNGLSSAQLASVFPQSGGTYEYGYRLLSPELGFCAGWMFLISKLAAGGVVALGFGTYFSQLFPVINPKLAAISAVIVLTSANYFGIKKAGNINLVIVAVTLASLLYFIITGIPSFDSANLKPFAPEGITGIAQSAALLFFAFTGYARITTLGEEVHEPAKTIPKAVIITLVLSVLLYSATSLVAIGNADAASLSGTSAPLSLAASNFRYPGVAFIIGIGATTAMFGVLLSQILGISRMMFAMSRKHDLPAFLQSVHPRYKVPHAGIFVSAGVIILLSLFGTLQFIVSTASFTILLYYGITNIAALKLDKKDRRYPNWIAVLGLISCLALAASLSIKSVTLSLLLLTLGFTFRWVLKRNV
ncbi:MAG TPA: amino acid permease [Sphingobacteriaceae bacterium]